MTITPSTGLWCFLMHLFFWGGGVMWLFQDIQELQWKHLVFRIAGISTKWKQAVAYYFSGALVKGAVIQPVIEDIISICENVDLYVHSVTSDMDSENEVMWKSFGIASGRKEKTVSSVEHPWSQARLHFIADLPHLKRIRISLVNNMTLKFQIMFNRNIISPPSMLNQSTFQILLISLKLSQTMHVINHDASSAIRFFLQKKHQKR